MKKSFFLVVTMIQLVLVSKSFAAPIHRAAKAGNLVEVLRLITEYPLNRDAVDRYGDTPLHWATVEGNISIVQVLITQGADVNARNYFSMTPLHFSATKGHTETTQLLIAHGANAEARNLNGYTPLKLATVNHRASTVAALQPQAIAQHHTQTAASHGAAGNHALAARSHIWAAQVLAGTEEAKVCYTRAAESFVAAGDDAGAAKNYDLAGNHAQAVIHQTHYAHNQAAAGDYSTAVDHYHLAHAVHTALGNYDSARLSHHLATLLAPAIPAQDHLTVARRHTIDMEIQFRKALEKAVEMKSHRDRYDEAAATLSEPQVGGSLESANRSEELASVAFQTAHVALDGALEVAMNAHEEARVASAPAEHLAQYAALVESLRTQMRSVSSKIDETHASAAASRELVSVARGLLP